MDKKIDTNFAFAILILVAALVGFSFWLIDGHEKISDDAKNMSLAVSSESVKLEVDHDIREVDFLTPKFFDEGADFFYEYEFYDLPIEEQDELLSDARDTNQRHWVSGAPYSHSISSYSVEEILLMKVIDSIEDVMGSTEQSPVRTQLFLFSESEQFDVATLKKEKVKIGDRDVLVEYFPEGDYRCVFFSQRMNDQVVAIYSGCGKKSFIDDNHLQLPLDSEIKEKLQGYKQSQYEKLSQRQNSQGIVYYADQGRIKKYDAKNDKEEALYRYSQKVGSSSMSCGQFNEQPVLVCRLVGYEIYDAPTTLFFVETNLWEDLDGCWTEEKALKESSYKNAIIDVSCSSEEDWHIPLSKRDITRTLHFDRSGESVR